MQNRPTICILCTYFACIIIFQAKPSDHVKIERNIDGYAVQDIYKYSGVNCETYKAILANNTSLMANFFTDGPLEGTYYITFQGYSKKSASNNLFESFKEAFDDKKQEKDACWGRCFKRLFGKNKND